MEVEISYNSQAILVFFKSKMTGYQPAARGIFREVFCTGCYFPEIFSTGGVFPGGLVTLQSLLIFKKGSKLSIFDRRIKRG